MREWAATAPLWQLWAYFFLAWTLIQMVITLDQSPVASIVGGVGFASLMTASTARHRRRDARAAGGMTSGLNVRQLERAIETGHLPADPRERAALRGLTERRIRQARLMTWLGPVVFGGFTLLGLGLLIATHSVSSLLETCIFVFFLVWGVITPRKQRAKAEAVAALLDRQAI